MHNRMKGIDMEHAGDSVPNEPKYEVLWPLSRKAVSVVAAAPRIPDLNGKTIGELWDRNFRGETIYPLAREYIRARFPGVKFVDYSNFDNFHGPNAENAAARLPGQLSAQGCDAVIVGIGA